MTLSVFIISNKQLNPNSAFVMQLYSDEEGKVHFPINTYLIALFVFRKLYPFFNRRAASQHNCVLDVGHN